MPTSSVIAGFGLFVIGHILAWFQLNSQFVWQWWQKHPIFTVALYAVPTGLCFLMGSRLIVEATGALWTSRFLAFSASYLAFPLLTWHFMGETMLTTKTMVCVLLSCMIVAVQLFWK